MNPVTEAWTIDVIPILCKDLNLQEMQSLRIQLMLSIFLKCNRKWWKMLQNICNKCRFHDNQLKYSESEKL